MFTYTILKKDSKSRARLGSFETPHGKLMTPELAFVATEGVIKSIPKEKLPNLPINLIIVNTYHLFVKNILNTFSTPGKIHDYANFNRPISSDSGGFQVFSLGFGKSHGVGKVGTLFPGYETKPDDDKNNPLIISEEGTEFVFDGKKIKLTPEISMDLQHKIGADIMFAFDECTSPLNSYEYTKIAMERTHRWLERCLITHNNEKARYHVSHLRGRAHFAPHLPSRSKVASSLSLDQALFAIVQGGYFEDLRKISASHVGRQDVPGFGIGGSLGKTKEEILKVLEWTIPLLPDEKPRHLLGIGQVRDLFECVERGVDLFDCVIPTREARHKVLYTKKGKLALRKMKTVKEVIEKDCRCEACANNITMEMLYGYFLKKDPLAFYYATVHNIQFFADLMKAIRNSIEADKFSDLKERFYQYY